MTLFTRRFFFRAQHRLIQGHHPEVKHGHEYSLEITLLQNFSTTDISTVAAIVDKLDGKMLNETLPEGTISSGENITEWIDGELRRTILGKYLQGVALQETPKNRFVSGRSNSLIR